MTDISRMKYRDLLAEQIQLAGGQDPVAGGSTKTAKMNLGVGVVWD